MLDRRSLLGRLAAGLMVGLQIRGCSPPNRGPGPGRIRITPFAPQPAADGPWSDGGIDMPPFHAAGFRLEVRRPDQQQDGSFVAVYDTDAGDVPIVPQQLGLGGLGYTTEMILRGATAPAADARAFWAAFAHIPLDTGPHRAAGIRRWLEIEHPGGWLVLFNPVITGCAKVIAHDGVHCMDGLRILSTHVGLSDRPPVPLPGRPPMEIVTDAQVVVA